MLLLCLGLVNHQCFNVYGWSFLYVLYLLYISFVASGSADVATASTVTLCDSPQAREENRYFSSGGVSNRKQEGQYVSRPRFSLLC